MAMHNPKLYEKYNSFPKRDALLTLQEYGKKMNKKQASIIDIGCGDGLVTNTILKKYIPQDFKEVLGVDISEAMLMHAKNKYSDEKTSFEKFDISDELPESLKGKFDHAFSSFVLMFVVDQRKAYQNIYDILKKDGSFLAIVLGPTPFFHAYHELAKEEKWRADLKNVNQIMPKIFTTEESVKKFEEMLREIGFTDVIVRKEKTYFDFESIDNVRKMAESANFYKLKGERLEELLDAYVEKIRASHEAEEFKDSEIVRLYYYKVIIYGKK